MTDATIKTAATCEHPWVCCAAVTDREGKENYDERYLAPVKAHMAQDFGANHFIETRLQYEDTGKFFVRIDGYKK